MDENTKLLLELSQNFSSLKKDVEYIKEKMEQQEKNSDKSDNSIKELIEERTRYAATRQDGIKAELQTTIQLLSKENELQSEEIKKIKDRITELENQDSRKVMKRWEQVKDNIFKIGIGFIGSALVYYAIHLLGAQK